MILIKNNLKYLGIIGAFLFGFSLMASKSGMNIGLGLMIFCSIFYIKNFNINKLEIEQKFLLVILILTPVFSLLSPGGKESFEIALKKAYRYFPIFFIPIFLTSERYIKILIGFIYGTIIINFFNGILYYKNLNWNFKIRYQSFGNNLLDDAHMFTMLSFIVLGVLIYTIKEKKYKYFIISLIVYLCDISGVLLGQSRGSWIALIGGIVLFFILLIKNKKLLLSIFFIIVICSGILLKSGKLDNNYYINRFKSIKNISSDSPKIRILMWEGAIDTYKNNPIFGSGRDNSSKYILKYLEDNKKYEEVQNKYMLREIAKAGNPHNMYFSSISEEGILSLLLFSFWGFILLREILFFKILKKEDLFYYLMIGCISLTFTFYLAGLTENAWRNIWKANVYLIGVSLFLSIRKIENNIEG